MTQSFKISLRPNEKIYVNGAVLRFDRRTSIEFLNDVNFLLEAHVMQLEDVTSPLHQLYYIIQIMLMSPGNDTFNRSVYARQLDLIRSDKAAALPEQFLRDVDHLVASCKYYEAMKLLRTSNGGITIKRQDGKKTNLDGRMGNPVKAA